jgi:hypothetical protein
MTLFFDAAAGRIDAPALPLSSTPSKERDIKQEATEKSLEQYGIADMGMNLTRKVMPTTTREDILTN